MRRIPEIARPARLDPRMDEAFENGHHGIIVTDHLQIRDYVRIFYRRRWIIAAIMVAGLIAGVLRNWTATRIFEAAATLQIGADPNVLGLERPLVDQKDWMREFLPTQLAVLESRELASMASEEMKIASRSTEGGERQVLTGSEILDGRTVSPLSNTRLVSIGFRSTNAASAAQAANALARAYVKWNTVSKASTTGEASDWLKGQVEEQRRLVQKSEAALQRYKKEHEAEALGERQNIVVQKLGELQSAATRARAETIEKQTQYQQLSTLESTHGALDTLPAIASNPYIHGIKDELASLQQQLAQASAQLGELHPDIIKLRGAVDAAERKLRTEIAKLAAAIRNEYEAARAGEGALTAAFERQKLEVQALNAKAVEYTALDRTATANRLLLDNLEQRSKQITLSRDLPSASASLLDPAEVPGAPILPRKERNIVMALSGSGALALALVFLLEFLNTRVTSPDDVRRHLGIPVLGVAPKVKLQNGHTSLLLSDGAPPELTELLHGVRTNLLVAPELASSRTLLVTSSEAGEGKTLTAANLAVSLAQMNQRVLLIDADLRKPRLHELFGEELGPGLTDLLTGKATSRAVRKTKVSRLWLIPSGRGSRNPADLLGSERFSTLIDCLRPQVDWVVIDSPPVLAVADPCVIARVVGGVLLVVGSGKTSRDVASAAVERLDAVGARLVGAMLNRAVLDRRGESYLPYYHRDSQTYYSQQENSLNPEVLGAPSNGAPGGAAAPHVQSDATPPHFAGFTIATSHAEAPRAK
jgi:succinoglycan biosynthesis transport protein ExoP